MRWGARRWLAVFGASCAAAVASGCGGDSSTPDAGARDGAVGDAMPSPATPPDVPWLAAGVPPVAIAPCPDGWREVPTAGVVTCEPYPEEGPATCADGQAHFVGEPGCVAVGDPCPTGDFADGLPTDGSVIYVRAGATGGDGSAGAPFGSLAEVPWIGPAGRTVALARGRYAGVLPLRPGTRVVGACAAETLLVGTSASSGAVVTVAGPGTAPEVRGVTIVDAPQIPIAVEGTGRGLVLSGVVLRGARTVGILVRSAASLAADSLVVAHSTADAYGIVAAGDATTASLRRVVVEDTAGMAVQIEGGATLELTDAAVRDTRVDPATRVFGRGLQVVSGGRATVERAIFEGNHEHGLFAAVDGAITASLVVVRGTEPRSLDGRLGTGASAQNGGRIELSRATLDGNSDVGVLAGEGGAISLADVVLSGTRAAQDGTQGIGAGAFEGGELRIERAVLAHNRTIGAAAIGDGSALSLVDVLIRDTQLEESTMLNGRGIESQLDVRVDVSRTVIVQGFEGVRMTGPGGLGTFTDVVIRDQGIGGETNTGGGFWLQRETQATLSRVAIDRVMYAGVTALEVGVTIRDLSVADVGPRACPFPECIANPGGHGVVSAIGATVDIQRFSIRRVALCGALVALDGQLDLAEGEVIGAQIGACVQVDGYDPARLGRGVTMRETGTPVQATSLPVPEVQPP